MPTGYMVRRKGDGLYSSGGDSPSFGAHGRIWATRQNLVGHLRRVTYGEEYEIVEVEIRVEIQARHEIKVITPDPIPAVVHWHRRGSTDVVCGAPDVVARSNRRSAVTCPNCIKTTAFKTR